MLKTLEQYFKLEFPENKVLATYIWIDGTGEKLRCKDRTLDFIPNSVKDLPLWNYCGQATFQATSTRELNLHPVAIYRDPFRRGNNILVMCETYSHDGKPLATNHRSKCAEVASKCAAEEPWIGIEQEYTLLDTDGRLFRWPKNGIPGVEGTYYCGIGAENAYGRCIAEAHYRACLYAGIKICGTNAEAMPAQWEFQIGPCVGVSAGDDLWIARFILHRIAEDCDIVVTLDPRPINDDKFHGSGAHTNVSTKRMREKNGIFAIDEAIEKLSKCHMKHIKAYDPNEGKDNERRLTGKNDTSSIHDFTSG